MVYTPHGAFSRYIIRYIWTESPERWVYHQPSDKNKKHYKGPAPPKTGYCQKTGDIVNLKSGYWILPTENGILIRILGSLKLGYWDIGFTSFPVLPPLAQQGEDTNFFKSEYRDIGPPGAGPYYINH